MLSESSHIHTNFNYIQKHRKLIHIWTHFMYNINSKKTQQTLTKMIN